jgi:hypothetical protein
MLVCLFLVLEHKLKNISYFISIKEKRSTAEEYKKKKRLIEFPIIDFMLDGNRVYNK